MKGYCIPDEALKKAKGYDKLENLSSYDLTINSSIDSLVLTLFDFRKSHFIIENAVDGDWSKFFTEMFIDDNYTREIYGQYSYDLEGFLRGVLHSIIVFGKSFCAVDYLNDGATGRWIVERIRWLPVETVSPVYEKEGAIKGFTQQYSAKCSYETAQNYEAEFLPDEVFFVEWVFDEDKKGVSPLLALLGNSQTENKLFDLIQKQSYAFTHPDDHSRNAERARYSSFQEAKKRSDIAKIKSIAKIGGIIQQPMTDYYYAYYFAKNRKKVAAIREYLVDQFNAQVLTVISRKNNLPQPARIKIVGYLSAQEIAKLIDDLKSLKISSKELVDVLAKDMHPPSKLDS